MRCCGAPQPVLLETLKGEYTLLNGLATLVAVVDTANEWIGRVVAWLTLGCVLTCFLVVVLRYGFSIGFPWMQELYVWQLAVVFMVGAGFTLLHGGHVNVDIAYSRFPARTKAWVDILGTLVFLLPWMAVLAWTSSQFVLASWAILEPSSQSNGMPGLYLLKTMIWVFCAVISLQGIALIARRVLFLNGRDDYSPNAASASLHSSDAGA
ncbi:MAG: TRAP transporter small permease subunit [Alphaproteobacteria bacterium]|nr:TRAP transporter small permease subunit [Alphaproteobacteria bacterium]